MFVLLTLLSNPILIAALGMQLDIMFTVTFILQFMQNPGWMHWEEVKQVFRYLKGTIDLQLVIGAGGNWTWAEEDK